MKVALLKTWLTNIGNGFIDKGAKQWISKAIPEAQIIEISGYQAFVEERLERGETRPIKSRLQRGSSRTKDSQNREFPKITDYIDVDLAVLPGCVLGEGSLRRYSGILNRLSDSGTKIVILGAGGTKYDNKTSSLVSEKLKEIDPEVLITRDEDAYNCYSDYVTESYNGIDCAFFINDWYIPPKANQDLSVLCFDKTDVPKEIEIDGNIIKPDHNPFGYPYPFETVIRQIKRRTLNNKFDTDKMFLSDDPKDYLFWYKNCTVTHSDRIHACVPSLVYGNKTQFHFETPRDALFDNVPVGPIHKKPVSIDKNKLEEIKNENIVILETAINNII